MHLIALLHPGVENERIFAFNQPFNFNDLLALFRKEFPDRKFVNDIPDLKRDLSIIKRRGRAEDLLKEAGQAEGFTGLKESLLENIQSLL